MFLKEKCSLTEEAVTQRIFSRKILAVKDNWIKKNKWDGIDPNNGDVYSKGLLIKEGPKQLEMFR